MNHSNHRGNSRILEKRGKKNKFLGITNHKEGF